MRPSIFSGAFFCLFFVSKLINCERNFMLLKKQLISILWIISMGSIVFAMESSSIKEEAPMPLIRLRIQPSLEALPREIILIIAEVLANDTASLWDQNWEAIIALQSVNRRLRSILLPLEACKRLAESRRAITACRRLCNM